jgi:hypothetical protein
MDQQISHTKRQSAAQWRRNIGGGLSGAGERLLQRVGRTAVAVEEITGCACAG